MSTGLTLLCLFPLIQDGSIVSTAAPTITDESNSLTDLGWYSSVYYMTFCIAQLQFGKLNVRYPIRIVYSCCMLFFFVRPPKTAPAEPLTLGGFFRTLDLYGLIVLTPCIACLPIALQWGGTTYAWSNGRIITLLTLFGVLVLAFVGVEWWEGGDAMASKRVVKQRSTIAAVLFAFTNGGSCYLFAYYIPMYVKTGKMNDISHPLLVIPLTKLTYQNYSWFQSCLNTGPIHAGINMLPLVVAQTIASILCGMGVAATGYIWPFMTATSCFTAIGAGFMTTFKVDISVGKWIGYQIVYGVGMNSRRRRLLWSCRTSSPSRILL